MIRRFAAAALLASLAAPAIAAAGDLRSVAGMQYHQRVLLAFAPSLDDPRLAAERREMAAMALEASARDLVLVQVGGGSVIGAHDQAAKLRRRFKVAEPEFRAFLIGKDGHAAIASATPLAGKRLIAAIDAMPMRRDEMSAAREGRMPPAR